MKKLKQASNRKAPKIPHHDEIETLKITKSSVDKLLDNLIENPTKSSCERFLKIFRILVSEENESSKASSILLEEPELTKSIMAFALQEFPKCFLNLFEKSEDEKLVITDKKLEILILVYLTNIYKFVNSLTDDQMLYLALISLQNVVDFIISQKRFVWKFLYFAIEQWATSDQLQIKLAAFIVIRKIAQFQTEEIDQILKKVYLAFVKNSKSCVWRNYELITFMINCYIELIQINLDASYYVAFTYIRQISIHLKECMSNKNKENIHKIYNWQYLNSIKLWARAIAAVTPTLNQLIYPLGEICHGILNLFFTSKFFPFYIQILRLMIELKNKCSVQLPIESFIFKIFNSNEFNSKKQNPSGKQFDFMMNIKTQKLFISTNSYWNELFVELLNLLLESLESQSKMIYYPELLVHIQHNLRLLKERMTFRFYKSIIKEYSQLLNKDKDIIMEKRCQFDYSLSKQETIDQFHKSIFTQKVQLKKKNKAVVKQIKSALEQKCDELRATREEQIKQKVLAEKEEFVTKDSENEEDDDEEVNLDESYENSDNDSIPELVGIE